MKRYGRAAGVMVVGLMVGTVTGERSGWAQQQEPGALQPTPPSSVAPPGFDWDTVPPRKPAPTATSPAPATPPAATAAPAPSPATTAPPVPSSVPPVTREPEPRELSAPPRALAPPPAPAPLPDPDPVLALPPPRAELTTVVRTEQEIIREEVTPSPGLGFGLQIGGGLVGFMGSEAQAALQDGAYWDVRAVAGLHTLVGLEVAYRGVAHPLPAFAGDEATLVGHGAEGALRLNVPLRGRRVFVTPFVLAGLGWARYGVVGSPARQFIPADDLLVLPIGAGLTLGYGRVFVEARFSYRFTAFDDLLGGASAEERRGQLRHRTFGANLGYVF